MSKYTPTQLTLLASFFSNVAVAWLSGGVLALVFSNFSYTERLLCAAAGIFVSTALLDASLRISRYNYDNE